MIDPCLLPSMRIQILHLRIPCLSRDHVKIKPWDHSFSHWCLTSSKATKCLWILRSGTPWITRGASYCSLSPPLLTAKAAPGMVVRGCFLWGLHPTCCHLSPSDFAALWSLARACLSASHWSQRRVSASSTLWLRSRQESAVSSWQVPLWAVGTRQDSVRGLTLLFHLHFSWLVGAIGYRILVP